MGSKASLGVGSRSGHRVVPVDRLQCPEKCYRPLIHRTASFVVLLAFALTLVGLLEYACRVVPLIGWTLDSPHTKRQLGHRQVENVTTTSGGHGPATVTGSSPSLSSFPTTPIGSSSSSVSSTVSVVIPSSSVFSASSITPSSSSTPSSSFTPSSSSVPSSRPPPLSSSTTSPSYTIETSFFQPPSAFLDTTTTTLPADSILSGADGKGTPPGTPPPSNYLDTTTTTVPASSINQVVSPGPTSPSASTSDTLPSSTTTSRITPIISTAYLPPSSWLDTSTSTVPASDIVGMAGLSPSASVSNSNILPSASVSTTNSPKSHQWEKSTDYMDPSTMTTPASVLVNVGGKTSSAIYQPTFTHPGGGYLSTGTSTLPVESIVAQAGLSSPAITPYSSSLTNGVPSPGITQSQVVPSLVIIAVTTTNSVGAVIATSATFVEISGAGVAPSDSGVAIVVTTTDSAGHPYVTTSMLPPADLITIITGTDKFGHTFTATATLADTFGSGQAAPNGVDVVYTTTDSTGSVYVTFSPLATPPNGVAIVFETTDTAGHAFLSTATLADPTKGLVLVVTTTDNAEHVFVTTETFAYPASDGVVTFTTTNSAGHFFVATETFVYPTSSTVVTFTTTDSAGRAFVTAETIANPADKLLAFTTTDSHGSLYTTFSTVPDSRFLKSTYRSTLYTTSSQSSGTTPTARIGSAMTSIAYAMPSGIAKPIITDRPLTFFSNSMYFFTGYMSVFIAVVFRFAIGWLYSTTKMFEPFYVLTGSRNASAKDFFNINYLSANDSFEPYKAMVSGHWLILWTSLLYLSAELVTPFASELLHFYQTCTTLDTKVGICAPAMWINPSIARIIQALLSLASAMLVAIWWMLRSHSSGVYQDPSSIATIASLLHHPGTLDELCHLDQQATKEETVKALEGKTFRLDTYQAADGNERYGLIVSQGPTTEKVPLVTLSNIRHSPLTSSENLFGTAYLGAYQPPHKQPRRYKPLNVARDTIFVSTLIGTLTLITIYYLNSADTPFERFMDSQRFGPRFLITCVGLIIHSQWARIEREFAVADPFRRLYASHAPAGESVLRARTLTPISTIFSALYHRSFYVALVAFVAFAAELLIIVMPGIPFSSGELFVAATTSVYLSLAILGLMLLTLLALVFRPKGPDLQRRPSTLGAMFLYLCDSRMRHDLADLARLRERERSVVVRGWGREYGLRFENGKGGGGRRWRVDYEDWGGKGRDLREGERRLMSDF